MKSCQMSKVMVLCEKKKSFDLSSIVYSVCCSIDWRLFVVIYLLLCLIVTNINRQSEKILIMARVTTGQLTYLIDFLEGRRDLALGHVRNGTEGREESKRLWNQVAQGMRSLGLEGAEKDGTGWRLFYNDYKFKLKKKIRDMKSQISATGGGRRKEIVLSGCEERLYDILGRDLGDAISGVRLNPLDINIADYSTVHVDVVDDGLASVNDASTILDSLESGNISPLLTVVEQAVPEDKGDGVIKKKRRRKNRDENELPSSCARDETELSQAQSEFRKTEEMACNSRLVLAESNNNMANAINNLASAIREYGGIKESVRGNKKQRRRIMSSDSE